MIQIEDWVIIVIILAFFFASLSYLVYFVLTKKLFPIEKEFQNEINPNKMITLLTIEGSGIIKKIEMQITENNNSFINISIDGTTITNFIITKEPYKKDKTSQNEQKGGLLKLEINLDTEFRKDFSISLENRSDYSLNSTGKIFYEIKRPLKVVLKAVFAEITS
jgi:hypothetical protein